MLIADETDTKALSGRGNLRDITLAGTCRGVPIPFKGLFNHRTGGPMRPREREPHRCVVIERCTFVNK